MRGHIFHFDQRANFKNDFIQCTHCKASEEQNNFVIFHELVSTLKKLSVLVLGCTALLLHVCTLQPPETNMSGFMSTNIYKKNFEKIEKIWNI